MRFDPTYDADRMIRRETDAIERAIERRDLKIHITSRQDRALKREKERTGLAVTDIVRRAIDYYLTAPTSVRGGDESDQ
jgi:hypothetical protein